MEAGWSKVGSFADRGGASVALTLLQDAGIDGRLQSDDVGGMRPDLTLLTGGVQLVVPDHQADHAHALLDRLSWTRPRQGDASSRTRRVGERGISVLVMVVVAATTMAALLHAF